MQTLFRQKKSLFWKISNRSFLYCRKTNPGRKDLKPFLIIWLHPKVLTDNLVATFFFSYLIVISWIVQIWPWHFQLHSIHFNGILAILRFCEQYLFTIFISHCWFYDHCWKPIFWNSMLIYLLKKITFPFNIIYIFKLYNFFML